MNVKRQFTAVNPLEFNLGPMPTARRLTTVDERIVHASVARMFEVAADVERWPAWLSHYRFVRFRSRSGRRAIVEMSADRPFGRLNWPTWWMSQMEVDEKAPAIRFRHIGGITTGMDVEWTFEHVLRDVHVRIVHVWDGPEWPLIGGIAATQVIGPVFVHGIASRTLAGLAGVAENVKGTIDGARQWKNVE